MEIIIVQNTPGKLFTNCCFEKCILTFISVSSSRTVPSLEFISSASKFTNSLRYLKVLKRKGGRKGHTWRLNIWCNKWNFILPPPFLLISLPRDPGICNLNFILSVWKLKYFYFDWIPGSFYFDKNFRLLRI